MIEALRGDVVVGGGGEEEWGGGGEEGCDARGEGGVREGGEEGEHEGAPVHGLARERGGRAAEFGILCPNLE